MEDYSCTENITNCRIFLFHVLDVDDFRGNESSSSASDEEIVWLLSPSCQSEISHDQVVRVLTILTLRPEK